MNPHLSNQLGSRFVDTLSEIRPIFICPTQAEYDSVNRALGSTYPVIKSGSGKINMAVAFMQAKELIPDKGNCIICAGTSGALSRDLTSGDIVLVSESLISDYGLRLSDSDFKVSPYDLLPDEANTSDFWQAVLHSPEEGTKDCPVDIQTFLSELEFGQFRTHNISIGRALTSDAFIGSADLKVTYGERFNCRVCDMETGALAYLANKFGVSWFAVRIVVDTIQEEGDHLTSYINNEKNFTEGLAEFLSLLFMK